MKTCCIKSHLVLAGLGLLLAGRLTAQTFTVLRSFTAGTDGAQPYRSLLLSGNTLYGAAHSGGPFGSGTLFKLNTDGTGFTNLHSFTATSGALKANTDGKSPTGDLILSGTTLYGTTWEGGSVGYGTVFGINTDGTGFTNLHSFTDEVYQVSGLLLSSNILYGTTDLGGAAGNGRIFALNTDGTGFTTLYSFTPVGNGINADGAYPLAVLIVSGSTLYGTTAGGGGSRYGTIFRLNAGGTGFTNLHNFTSDGYDPNAGLTPSGDTLFGVTDTGLTLGLGTVFKINTGGTDFTTLHQFSGSDGAYAGGTLLLLGNRLYSIALGGGSGNGVIYTLNCDGSGFEVLHTFSAAPFGTNSDGTRLLGSLVSSGNLLYGAASGGGSMGSGTVFSISLPPQLTLTPAGANVILSWPTNAAGFTLQSAADLASPTVWSNVPAAALVLDGLYTVTNPLSAPRQFYRLSQ